MMKNAIAIIAVVLIGLILLGPSILGGFSDAMKQLDDWVQHGWEYDLNDIDIDIEDNDVDTEGSEGIATLKGIVRFKDGTQQTVDPEGLTFTLFPMAVFFDGQEVEGFEWTLGARITWTGDVYSIRVSGSLGCWHGASLINEREFSTTYFETDIEKEEWFQIQELIVMAEDINSIVPEGTQTLTVTTEDLTFRATFDSGHVESHTLGPGVAPVWELQVTIEAETLTVLSANLQMGFYPA